jgi:spermidine synthase
MLGLLLGASVYTFSIILAVFLAGLGMGSAVGSFVCRTALRPRVALAACQLLNTGAIAWTAYMLGASFPYWPITPSVSSSIWFNLQLDLTRAFWALLPPTLFWGASFPLAMAALAPTGMTRRDSGKLVSTVYAANTIGAIAGALGANLLFIGWIGSQRSEQLVIAVSAAAGLLMIQRWHVAVPAVLAAGLLMVTVPPLSKDLVTHGRFAPTWVGRSDIVYAGEGMNASVAVSVFPNGARTFHVAGKIQASSVARDMRLQRMLGHLTSLTAASPIEARSVLVIGCGAGVTAGAVSIDPRVERVTIVEIEPLVPEAASTYFAEHNFDVIRSPKVQVHIDDGRHFLLTTRERFDAITADPLDPWVKGAANLYTKEFFEAAKQRLNPGGVVTVYIQLFETNLDAVKSAVATFFEVFPNGTVWGNTYEGRGHDMLLLGQVEPLRIELDEMDERLSRPEYASVAQSLSDIGMNSVVDLFATYAGRGSDLKAWLNGAAINRDRNLRMQYLAGTALNLDESAAIYEDMLAHRKFPADLFVSKTGRVDSLREAVLAP